MGMDVSGKNADHPIGGYFRNNVWWWHPLATYILENAPEEITSNCEYWHSNDGDGLDAENSVKLADWMDAEIASGRTQKWIDKHNKTQEGEKFTYPASVENMQKFSAFLRHCGGFEIF